MRVEFFGIPRQRAGVSALETRAACLGELLQSIRSRLPALGEVIDGDRLRPAYIANLNGERFVSEPTTPLADTDCVLILSADAGG